MKPTLKAPGTKRLQVKYDELFQFCFNVAFNINLRRYHLDRDVRHARAGRQPGQQLIHAHGRAVQVDSIKTRVESVYGFSD